MRTFIKYIIILLMFFGENLKAQELSKSGAIRLDSKTKDLKIGDKVPDLTINKIINDIHTSARISDFNNQLLILDFWDSYCGSCIKAMPKLDSLQKNFGNRIKILLVNWQKRADVVRFFKTNRFLKNQKIPVNLPTVVEDKILAEHFKHIYIPHTVWIYKGKIVAITLPEYLNAQNIESVLKNHRISLPTKNDFFDKDKALMTLNDVEQYNQNSKFFSYSVITGQREGLSKPVGWDFSLDSLTGKYRIALFNLSIVEAYKVLLFNSDSIRKDFVLTPGRLILEVKDLSKYIFDPFKNQEDQWNRENQICYEMIRFNTATEKQMARMAVNDLNSKLGLFGRWEKRKIKCLVLIKNKNTIVDTLAVEKGGVSIPVIAFFKLDNVGRYPPAVDETNFKGGIKLEPYDGTLDGLKKEMQRHGLDLIEAERDIDVMVITEI